MTAPRRRWPAILALAGATTGCLVGPDYQRPAAPLAERFKEAPPGWHLASPGGGTGPHDDDWWAIYHDPLLDRLERQVKLTNQNVQAFEAQRRVAQAAVDAARAALFPTLGVAADVTRSRGGGAGNGSGTGTTGGGGGAHSLYSLEATGSWDLDLWGRIRRQVESDKAASAVAAADLAAATLSAQGTLAADYFDLCGQDALHDLLSETVIADREALRITENQVTAGTGMPADQAVALTLVETTEALLIQVAVARAQDEHAIAVLAGMAPADLAIPPARLPTEVPVIPIAIPSALLERRPDIVAAERAMAAENALIGVQIAAFYPDISLTAVAGFAGDPLSAVFTAANRVWSLGAAAGETLFDGGARAAAVTGARASYDASIATYRQTVLSAFQQVEDQLVALRVDEQAAAAETRAIRSAEQALQILLRQYQSGTISYTGVVTAETTLLGDQEQGLAIQKSRMMASVALVQALGGGWHATELAEHPP